MVSQAKPQANEGKIIPIVLGKGQRFPGIGLPLTFFPPKFFTILFLYIFMYI